MNKFNFLKNTNTYKHVLKWGIISLYSVTIIIMMGVVFFLRGDVEFMNEIKRIDTSVGSYLNYPFLESIVSIAYVICFAGVIEEYIYRSWIKEPFKNFSHFHVYAYCLFAWQIVLAIMYNNTIFTLRYYEFIKNILYRIGLSSFDKGGSIFILLFVIYIPTLIYILLKNIINIRPINKFLLIQINKVKQTKLFNNPAFKKILYYSLIITSILTFAKLHANPDNFVGFNLSYFLPYIIAGVVLTLVRLFFSLKASIILHMMNNTIGLLLTYTTLLTPIADRASMVLFIIVLVELVVFYKLTKIENKPEVVNIDLKT
jgi:hypothetical protein